MATGLGQSPENCPGTNDKTAVLSGSIFCCCRCTNFSKIFQASCKKTEGSLVVWIDNEKKEPTCLCLSCPSYPWERCSLVAGFRSRHCILITTISPVGSYSASYSIEIEPIVLSKRSRKAEDNQTLLRQLVVDAFPDRYPDLEVAGKAECVVRILRGEGLMASLALISEFDRELNGG